MLHSTRLHVKCSPPYTDEGAQRKINSSGDPSRETKHPELLLPGTNWMWEGGTAALTIMLLDFLPYSRWYPVCRRLCSSLQTWHFPKEHFEGAPEIMGSWKITVLIRVCVVSEDILFNNVKTLGIGSKRKRLYVMRWSEMKRLWIRNEWSTISGDASRLLIHKTKREYSSSAICRIRHFPSLVCMWSENEQHFFIWSPSRRETPLTSLF